MLLADITCTKCDFSLARVVKDEKEAQKKASEEMCADCKGKLTIRQIIDLKETSVASAPCQSSGCGSCKGCGA